MTSFEDKMNRWGMSFVDTPSPDEDYLSLSEMIEYLAHKRFHEYHPTAGPSADFMARLEHWLDNLPSSDDDQKLLVRLVPRLFFVGSYEFKSLYRVALNGHIKRWLIDIENIPLEEASFGTALSTAISETWFCPVTDSMQIAEFYHINRLSGPDYRPDWRSLAKFGNPDRIADYMGDVRLRRLVLLEDFIGSGSQLTEAVEFAANMPNHLDVLVVPLIACPEGVTHGRLLASNHDRISFAPVLELREQAFITRGDRPDDDDFVRSFRELLQRTNGLTESAYGPYGYRDTGGLIIMYTNCPDNTLPVVHQEARHWKPLFPRSSRLAV